MGSSSGFTKLQILLPFLRFSTLYPKRFVPPVLEGAVQARLIQSLKALTIFGADGGPGNAEGIKRMNHTLTKLKQNKQY